MATELTVIDYALPRHSRVLSSVLLVIGGSALCAIASQVLVPLPFTPVPVNGLTFAVLLLGATLGWQRGAAAVLLFLFEGLAGLPVFAELKFGAATLFGPTGGYLMASPVAAALVGFLAQRRWDRNALTLLAALLVGDAVIFGFGVAWLSRLLPTSNVLHVGLIPFLPGEAVKISLILLLVPATWRMLESPRRDLSDPRD